LISGLVSSVLYQVEVVCQSTEFNRFSEFDTYPNNPNIAHALAPPNGQTCGAYASAFATAVGGYINNPSAIAPATCEFCQYRVGQSFYTPLAISFDTRWRDLGIFVSFDVR
jgi:ABC-type multidrug transport system permease subunit